MCVCVCVCGLLVLPVFVGFPAGPPSPLDGPKSVHCRLIVISKLLVVYDFGLYV